MPEVKELEAPKEEVVKLSTNIHLKCNRVVSRVSNVKKNEIPSFIESLTSQISAPNSKWFLFVGENGSSQSCLIQIDDISHVMISEEQPEAQEANDKETA